MGWYYGKNEFIETISNYNRKLYTDSLTGAYNRYYFDEQLLGLASIEALAMIDVDNFKKINDTYGHLAGDASLCAIVKAIGSSIRSSDKIVRYGGDEFMLVFAKIPKKVFLEKLEQIRKKVSETSIAEVPDIRLTVSIGAVYELMPVPEALREADQMLYAAKAEKNSVRMKEMSGVPACWCFTGKRFLFPEGFVLCFVTFFDTIKLNRYRLCTGGMGQCIHC